MDEQQTTRRKQTDPLERLIISNTFSPNLINTMASCRRSWGMGFPVLSDLLLRPFWIDAQREAIRRFVAEVEKEAEENMLKTGKLEGAHYAAMKRITSRILK
jgi:hypothetical protein